MVKATDAGFKALFPCKPERSKKLFQKEPKEANLYSYKCDYRETSFSVSLPERFEEFDAAKTEEQLSGIERTLRQMIGSNAAIKTKNQPIEGYEARAFEVESETVYGIQLNIAHPRGTYGVQGFGKFGEASEKIEIEEMVRKFIESFAFL
jgi:hypothetical protein